MVLTDDNCNQVKLLLLENNKVLSQELTALFVTKDLFFKVCAGFGGILIGMCSPQMIPVIKSLLSVIGV